GQPRNPRGMHPVLLVLSDSYPDALADGLMDGTGLHRIAINRQGNTACGYKVIQIGLLIQFKGYPQKVVAGMQPLRTLQVDFLIHLGRLAKRCLFTSFTALTVESLS